ncbi:hypothetical protein LNQ82_06000 [Conchiformibius steedae DSM 2580]|uniref:Uncharacterized protein n=2 Tax=Conchiformibius steedae TaxID=153493 RepID=A0A3P2A2A2_9NEIS|nr:hypothetical protein [Conchiformibius steedae]QMT34012.1 hypothetical protein H3L98_03080 [Conchiformibius steedae]RRD89547.1 hypothetical protein EII21_08560 [Conchiformibius steedae]URD66783.1 hypothetical protein LNQ82_06000 [Conchiformibius steedae DSM 2580]
MKKLYLYLLLGSFSALPLYAQAKPAQCLIESSGEILFKGKCNFSADRDGSFTLENIRRNGELYDNILMVSVSIVSPKVAHVRGVTSFGNSSYWGDVRRSRTQPACWANNEFKICAW